MIGRVLGSLAAGVVFFAAEAREFEKIAFIDGWDYGHIFETETREGTGKVLDNVLKTGADTVLWRTHSGAVPRYASAQEDLDALEMPFDRRRMPDARTMQNWMKVWAMEPDALQVVFEECAKRPQIRRRGVHMLLEDAHWQFCFLGNWNLEHPQYMCRDIDGTVQMFHQSFAYPEVVEHRLAVAREIVERGLDTVYFDVMRNGGWGIRYEYTEPNLREWDHRHPGVPPPRLDGSDKLVREWMEVVAVGFMKYLRGLSELVHRKGARLIVNTELQSDTSDWWWVSRACDWRKLVDEGVIDGLAITGINADADDPFGSVERRFRRLMDQVGGKRPVYFPILAYNFHKTRPSFGQIATYAKVPQAEAVRKLLEIAARCGAAGIVMECVDYGNYPEDVCKVIREFGTEGSHK